MDDFRDQLAAIRSNIAKAPATRKPDTSSPPTFEEKVEHRVAQPESSPGYADILSKCLCRLPWAGRITKFDVTRGFGFISGGGKKDHFFHASGKIPVVNGRITEDLINRYVIYAIGSSELKFLISIQLYHNISNHEYAPILVESYGLNPLSRDDQPGVKKAAKSANNQAVEDECRLASAYNQRCLSL